MNNDADSVHADLAKANLLRLRGDFAEAERLCVHALETMPESAAAHTLLGDIALSQDQSGQAVEHYEISLQLDSSSTEVARKLEEARALKARRENASSVEQLGLPKRTAIPWTTFGFAFFSLVCVVAAFTIGMRSHGPKVNSIHAAAPIIATEDSIVTIPGAKPALSTLPPQGVAVDSSTTAGSLSATASESTAEISKLSPPSGAPSVSVAPNEDRAMLQMIEAQSPLGGHLTGVSQDPRTKLVILTYSTAAGEDARRIGAELAKATLDQSGDTQVVTLRGVRDDRLIYMGDVTRAKYADTLTDTWKAANPAADAWIGYAVTNEWPYRVTDASDNGPKTP
jgi:hypothetical protein